MLVVTAFHQGDVADALRMYAWVKKLSNQLKSHDCLLVADPETPYPQTLELKRIASQIFNEVRLITLPESKKGWPGASEYMFQQTAEYINKKWPREFLWLESDSVPIKPSWLDEIEAFYKQHSKPYMGHIYEAEAWQPHLPKHMMSGIAVYPHDAALMLSFPPGAIQPWDINNAEYITRNGTNTPLILHRWGMPNLPPTFVSNKHAASPKNAFTLDFIKAETCLYHRNKDGSLIELLSRKLFPKEYQAKIVVVFPVHNGDIAQAVRHGEWLVKMGKKHEHEALISHDVSCNVIMLNQLQKLLTKVFAKVESHTYPRPMLPSYPACANWAWQNTALKMMQKGSPWLWAEADACALTPDWVEQIQEGYNRSCTPFYGPHVRGMSHSNGVMVYPSDAAKKMKTAMRLISEGAFDHLGAQDYMGDCADASGLIQHVWTIVGDEPCEVGGGHVPSSISAEQAKRWIRPSSVLFHRLKSTDLINLLISGSYTH